MSLEVIYVTRHGFRSNWVVDPTSGEYGSHLRSPTGIAADPALTAHGVDQAKELAGHLVRLDPPVERIYSSPYYRCLQTVQPFVERLEGTKRAVLGETGLSEWYGSAPFEHPTSAPPTQLKDLFPAYDTSYVPNVVPSRTGESIAQLHERVALTLDAIIRRCDESGVRAVLLCSHAATIIAIGRVLTGCMPEHVETEDFRVFTCGLSTFRRRKTRSGQDGPSSPAVDTTGSETTLDWEGGKGVGGGWTCEINSDCSFLSGGEERGWRFSGDEAFAGVQQDSSQRDAGVELGVIVEGKRKPPRL
ncbi:PGAM-domain-containing protein [Cryphonectria parasitica EP155]|uniref:PGAM-domain-containing protein n=1 Tax=Cryphonectria parasitica (strain ATCC 38755 / EP155) TaxID=660469 RepID=A0A9P4YA78_CRYP1|nr:PGAM-domain-containing protein [Cryphonectria parasitica EP155]KAF3769869.1 PGAM-domain-containing protein [Cryphonectria parasitica EP155]